MKTCKEVARLIASGEIEELSFLKRFSVRLHSWICGPCHCYEGQIKSIGRQARNWSGKICSDEEAREVEKRILASMTEMTDSTKVKN